jgi:hypothetical protein
MAVIFVSGKLQIYILVGNCSYIGYWEITVTMGRGK